MTTKKKMTSSFAGTPMTKIQMKQIMASLEEDPDCQGHGDSCNSTTALNCCNGLVCVGEGKCLTPTS